MTENNFYFFLKLLRRIIWGYSKVSYKDYYVGTTKNTYEQIIKYCENLYGKADHYYPDLRSYSRGYGDSFTVAKWQFERTFIEIDMYEKRELFDKNGYDSYKTKYLVRVTLFNFDKNFTRLNND